MSLTYTSSKLLSGNTAVLREYSLTRWLSPAMTQTTVDLCRQLGLAPAFSECSGDHHTRYLFWTLPSGASIEVRTSRRKEKFEELDRIYQDRCMQLLSLHINENEMYSAVWISCDFFEVAKAFLLAHGITVPERHGA